MITKYCQNKAVLVAVYAETRRPTRRLPVHHCHQGTRPRGCNRKAQLLDYARHLRASARPNDDHIHASSSNTSLLPSSHLTVASRPRAKPAKQFPPLQIVAADKKRNSASPPVCCSSWGVFSVATFLKTPKGDAKKRKNSSVSITMKMKHLVEGLRKNGNFVSKLLRGCGSCLLPTPSPQKYKHLFSELL